MTRDLATWERVYRDENSTEGDELRRIDRAGSGFLASGTASGCPDVADAYCPMTRVLVSSDGRTWSESTGPDGLPGPDAEAGFLEHGVATLRGTTVLLGQPLEGYVGAWVLPPTAIE